MESYLEPGRRLEEIIPEKTLRTRTPQFERDREVHPVPSRYRNEIAKYIISRDESKCTRCGLCVETCTQGVHVMKPGYKYFAEPKSHLCIGPVCRDKGRYCYSACPNDALRIEVNPMMKVLGDNRWTAEMILATWKMAETGEVPSEDYRLDYETGNSGGGFDRIRFKFPDTPPVKLEKEDIDTGIELNRRNDGRPEDTD